MNFHKHKFKYERHNSNIYRSCRCGLVEHTNYIEEPQLIATARTILPKSLIWKKI